VNGAFDGRRAAIGCLLLTSCASSPPPAQSAEPEGVPEDIVERSSLPLDALEHGEPLTLDEAVAMTLQASGVCVGESHDNPHHHFAQYELTSELAKHLEGRAFAIGFEMFQRPFQPALDRYERSGDVQALLAESEFDERWGYAFAYYAPLLRTARQTGAELLALNAPRELTKAVARGGLAELPPSFAQQLPELNLEDAEHRAFFERAMGMKFTPAPGPAVGPAGHQHGDHSGMSLENLYAAQLVWDETMADTGARWLDAHPGGFLVVIAGAGHCHESAIPRRIEGRGAFDIVAARAALHSELGRDQVVPDSAFELLLVLEDAPLAVAQATGNER
jgi:uncharacterized iron-regulated protein